MKKDKLQSAIDLAMSELHNAIEDAKKAAIEYGQGNENYPFEVGYLSSRIKGAISALEEVSLIKKNKK